MRRRSPSRRARTVVLAAVFGVTTFFVTVAPDEASPLERPAALAPAPVEAAYCASAPTFSGYFSDGLASPSFDTRSTTGDGYGYLTTIGQAWSCTAFYRYDGLAWARTADGSAGNFDWGTLIDSVSVACNSVVGSTDFLKANATNDCPDSDTEYALPIHLADTSISTLLEAVYRNDHSPDETGDFMFIHTDCDTYYGAADGNDDGERMRYDESFATTNVDNRPGANCDPLVLDPTDTAQSLVVDATAPSLAFDWPTAAGPTMIPSAFAGVRFDATDAVAGFAGADDWDLQRQTAAWSGSACGTFTNDPSAGSLTSGTTNALDQVVGQGLVDGACYRWTLTARDANGNSAASITSGIIRTDLTSTLGQQGQHTFETWDLGAGDSLAVNTATGNLVISHPVLSLPIRGGSVDITLAYNRHDPTNVGMGAGWRLSVQRRLAVNPDGSVTYTDESGARHLFSAPTGAPVVSYTRPATLYATLTRDTAATPDRFILTWRDRSRDVFDELATGTGSLVREEDRFGNGVSLGYSAGTLTAVTDTAANRTIGVAWTSGRLSAITDWVNVSGGIVQTSGAGNRLHRFFYDAGGNLIGWADPRNTSGSCPTNGSHLTCLTLTSGAVTAIATTQTYETFTSGTLGTATRTVTTAIGYANADVASVTDVEGAQTTLSHPAPGATEVVRPGTPASATTYTLVAATDALGRIGSLKRTLGAAQIETETTFDATYPIEPATVKENKGGGALERTTNSTYVASSLGLLARLDEPLDGTSRRWTDHTYNANNDVTQTIVSRQGDTATDTVTRYCYNSNLAACGTADGDLRLFQVIENYVDGTPGGTNGHVEDVTVAYQYDGYGRRTRETRQNYRGGTLLDQVATGWTYDTSGNVTAEIRNYANGTVTDPGDDITPNATTNARTDLTTAYTYDTAGDRVSTADPRRAIEAARGTSLGADDYISRQVFDALGRAVTSRLPTTPGQPDCGAPPGCREATTTYDELGLVREAADINDLVTATKYDRAGRALETYEDPPSAAAAITSISTYDAQGRLLTAKDRRQAATSSLGSTLHAYDELGRTTSVTDAYASAPDVASVTSSTYDNLDRTVTETVGGVQTTTWTYDIGGRTTKTDDEFTCATTSYDYRDLALVVTEGLDTGTCGGTAQRVITNSYDALGRLTNSEITAGEGDGDILAAPSYDAAGRQLTTSATKAGATTSSTFTLDPLDEAVGETRSEGGTPISWAKSNTDPAGNPTDRCVWNTNPGSELCKAVGQTFTTTPAVHTTTAYDARDGRTSLKVPGRGETTYDPTRGYLVDKVYTPLKLNGSNQVTAEHVADHDYDERLRLDGIDQSYCAVTADTHSCSGSATTTASVDYVYDDNDNRIEVTESATGGTPTTMTYCYDALDRVVAAKATTSCTSSPTETYTYDDAGNRETAPSTTFAYDAQGQLSSCTPTCGTIAYDDAGRTSRWDDWYLTYDGAGRLASACRVSGCATGDMATMRYDGEGRRIELVRRKSGTATTTTLRYQGDAIAQELTGSSVTRTFVTDEAGRVVKFCDPDCSGSNPQYLVTWNGHGDAVGIWLINGDGTLTRKQSMTYDTWGAPTIRDGSGTVLAWDDTASLRFRYLYVGAYGVAWDELGIGLKAHHMGARHYSPSLGRFLQPDPSRHEPNAYGYVLNNPATLADPSGLATARRILAGVFNWLVWSGSLEWKNRFQRDMVYGFTFASSGLLWVKISVWLETMFGGQPRTVSGPFPRTAWGRETLFFTRGFVHQGVCGSWYRVVGKILGAAPAVFGNLTLATPGFILKC